jgi:hypothetical protein
MPVLQSVSILHDCPTSQVLPIERHPSPPQFNDVSPLSSSIIELLQNTSGVGCLQVKSLLSQKSVIQSLLTWHIFVNAHGLQSVPPQLTSVSKPSLITFEQEEQVFEAQIPERQCLLSAHVLPSAHF